MYELVVFIFIYLDHSLCCGRDPFPRYRLFDDDDMSVVYTVLESCDVIVLGSPVYFDTASAQTKLMIDRCSHLMLYVKQPDNTYRFERRLQKRKKRIFIAVAGKNQEFDTILTTVIGFFCWVNIELKEKLFYAHEGGFGCVRKDKETLKRAFGIGISITKTFNE